ncbi:hypothetical protein B5F98_03095 [Pseudoflavonifractor sp. An44]|uniref:DNA-3-methyladenine glycosylase n=1 Tax=Pseudoflavonifractor sp. An44 TaxID=1965635 RepID=UPI000B3AC612|nr:DNA-3-methyladenine glycosylase [Pseudoflavonifractor sp. An44]OUN99031.1 hypothetical protein B5F98_03095 [Pseudoflavonifractor sp. An44]
MSKPEWMTQKDFDKKMKEKDRDFFKCPAEELAQKLIGKNLCHVVDKDNKDEGPFVIKARIRIAEAYPEKDKFTDGNREKNKTSQALEGGHLHLHTKCCEGRKRLDVVANKVDVSEGVLICGLDPYEDGPQRVVWAMEILDSADGMDMLKDDAEIWIEDDGTQAELKEPTKRKNIPDDKPLRFEAKRFIFK